MHEQHARNAGKQKKAGKLDSDEAGLEPHWIQGKAANISCAECYL